MNQAMELRNVAGRVCHDLANGAVSVPMDMPDGKMYMTSGKMAEVQRQSASVLWRSSEKSNGLKPLIQMISGATVLAVDETELPLPDFEDSASNVGEWMRLFSPVLWVDFLSFSGGVNGRVTKSALFFDPEVLGWPAIPEGAETARAVEGMSEPTLQHVSRTIYAIQFAHVSGRRYKQYTGHRHMTALDSGLVFFGIPEYWTKETPFAFGMSDFNDVEISSRRMWPDDRQLIEYFAVFLRKLMAVLYAVNVIQNVRLERVPPAHRVPKHERKYPKLDYHVLKIEKGRGTTSPKLQEQLRASPRQHLRRGHLRKIPQGRVTWIRPCIVGDAERGSIVKDYIL